MSRLPYGLGKSGVNAVKRPLLMSWSGQGASVAQERILPVLVVAEPNGCDRFAQKVNMTSKL